MVSRPLSRFPLLAMGMVALLGGLWAGLLRLGWGLPIVHSYFPASHGPLMISGFLGTLISLERAVALSTSLKARLGQRGTYVVPLLTGLGAVALIGGAHEVIGPTLLTLGSLGLVVLSALIVYLQPALFTATMGLAALCWLAGNVLWLSGWPIFSVVFWWIGFPVLTIAGERLELSRLLNLSRGSQVAFLIAVGLFLAGLILAGVNFALGVRLSGLGLMALALWLPRYDIARRTVRQPGLPGFIAVCLLSGYVWLGVGGLLALFSGGIMAGPIYDAMLHAIFLGFVFAMIFAHAPLIFPIILDLPVPFRSAFYAHLAVLHLSLILRVIGDLAGWTFWRQWGGLLNVVALLLFFANTGRSILQGLSKPTLSTTIAGKDPASARQTAVVFAAGKREP
jgi:hypothetical protein